MNKSECIRVALYPWLDDQLAMIPPMKGDDKPQDDIRDLVFQDKLDKIL
jgi:hypothetical protein